ncbi:MAG TPA: flagellin [Terracidiphilus sp.]|jgi:flagellin|nr:flagellin [Terracidiphilus sp.]
MSLGVLNNISAIYAQNNLSNTQASLSKTLQQLSSGSRINSGADDAAGLSLANGLQASSTALSQSAKNASEGVDFLQVADGALSQVTSLLNRAVTLATEASNGTLNSSQTSAANSEYQKILTEVNTINSNTEYNGISTFSKNASYTVGSAGNTVAVGTAAGNMTTVNYNGKTVDIYNSATDPTAGTGTASYLADANTKSILGAGSKLSDLASAINTGLGTSVASVQGNQLVLNDGAKVVSGSAALTETTTLASANTLSVSDANNALTVTTQFAVTANGSASAVNITGWAAAGGGTISALASAISGDAGLKAAGVTATVSGNSLVISGGTLSGVATESDTANSSTNQAVKIFTSDGSISQSYNNSASDQVSTSANTLGLANTSLASSAVAAAALTAINSAITQVAADRGTIGANINTLTAVVNVMTTQSTNTLAAENDVTATDYGQATSDMSKFQILSQTGIAALSQANQSQQLITKLLQ